jgi:hypothetical protein
MGLRFYRRIRILPGLRINLSKGGVSTSIGGRGHWLTFSKRGTRATVGVLDDEAVHDPGRAARGYLVIALLIAIVASVVAIGLLSSCSLLGSPPSYPSQAEDPAAYNATAARDRAGQALLNCVTMYATDNAGAAASASDIADAAVSHCGTELLAIDIANREGIRDIRARGQLLYGSPGISASEAERQVRLMHDDAVGVARGAALERVIALRRPGQ